jgi:lipoic acid synthetase
MLLPAKPERLAKPAWIRSKIPAGESCRKVSAALERHGLHTVCDEARCPNKGECWGVRTATFMVMGNVCTRGCRFCAVATAKEGQPLNGREGEELASAVEELGLRYVVLTSVDRDDLTDRGAAHFAACIAAIKSKSPEAKVEALIPDYTEAELAVVAAALPDVVAHNVETVRSLQWIRDARASFDKSLETLCAAKKLGAALTKTSLMLGLGETHAEVFAAMDEVREADADILVMGQYLQPSAQQIPVAEYLSPETFDFYADEARKRGFRSVVSAPLARTSYHAQDAAVFAVDSLSALRGMW